MNERSLSGVFQALSDPTRRGIVDLLRAGPRSAGELAEAFPLAKSTLSAHFTSLRFAGLVGSERQGRNIVYSLNPAVLEDVVGVLNDWLAPAPEAAAPGPAARLATKGGAPASDVRAHPPRHAGPERLRRRGAARAVLVEGALAMLLAGLAGRATGPAGPAAAAGVAPAAPAAPAAPPPATGPAPRRGRRGLGHLIRFGD
jgi:DNA-binding transcriptional ArsR family regulator